MVTGLESITKDMAVASLDALLLRHRVIAANIANHASEGFRPMRLEFESFLEPIRQAVQAGAGDGDVRKLLEDARAQVAVVEAPGDGTVRLDEEMTELAKNTLQYQALLTAIGKLGALKRLAITGEDR